MRAKLVNENIRFERGKDPKDAMEVGLAGLKKEILDNTSWSAAITPESVKIIDVIPDYEGYPILIMKVIDPIHNKDKPYQAVSNIPGSFVMNLPDAESAEQAVKKKIDDGIAYYEANKVKIDKMIAYYERMRKIKVVASEMRGKGNQDKGQGNPPDLPGNQGNNDQEPPVEPEPPANQGRQGNNK